MGTKHKEVLRHIIIAISMVFMILGIWYVWIFQGINYQYIDNENELVDFGIVELYQDEVVKQSFVPQGRYLKGIWIVPINLSENRSGSMTIELFDDKNQSIESSTLRLEEIDPGSWTFFPLESKLSKSKEYVLNVSIAGANEIPYLATTTKPEGLGLSTFQTESYEGTDMSLGIRFRYAKEASNYEKICITLLLISLLVFSSSFALEKYKKYINTIATILAGISLIGIFVLYIPNIAYKFSYVNLDESWRYFLNVANPEGYIFGKDIVFSYGPLGYLCFMMNLPENKNFFILGVAIWCIVIAAFIYLIWQLFIAYRKGFLSSESIVLSVLCALGAYKVVERDNFLLYLLILSVAVYKISLRYKTKIDWPLYVIPNFVLSIMFFAKFSTFSSATAFIVLFALYEGLVCKKYKSIFLGLPGIVAMPICYLIYNPSLKDLSTYIYGFLRFSNDWMESMQYDITVSGMELISLVIIMLFYVVTLVLSIVMKNNEASVIFAMSASMFFVYKYATTRHGLQCGIWLFGMIYSVLPLAFDFAGIHNDFEDINKSKHTRKFLILGTYVVLLGIVVTGVLETNVMHNDMHTFKKTISDKAHNWTHLSESGIEDEVFTKCMDVPEEILDIIGKDTVSIYPYKIALNSVYPELNVIYYPSATNGQFSKWFDQLVGDWFSSNDGPEYIIVNDEVVDNHIKYLENPLTWYGIRNNYSYVTSANGYCLLKRNMELIPCTSDMKLISVETKDIGDTITVPEGADFVKIKCDFDIKGKLIKFLYHVGSLNMQIVYDDGTAIQGRIVKNHINSGFELSYYPQNENEFIEYMTTDEAPIISTITLSGPGLKNLEKNCVVEWYSYSK